MSNALAIDLFVSQCEAFQEDALARLSELSGGNEVAELFCSRSLHGDQLAVRVVRKLDANSPFRRHWENRRRARIEEWVTTHHGLVVSEFRKRMRLFPNDAEDQAQSFWMWFLARDKDINYNSAIRPEHIWIRNLVRGRAIDALRSAVFFDELPIVDFAIAAAESHQAVGIEIESQRPAFTSPLHERLRRLLLTDAMKPHEALVFLASQSAGFPMDRIEESYADATMFQLFKDVRARAAEVLDHPDPPPFPALGARLELPFEKPTGSYSLRQISWMQDAESAGDKRKSDTRPLGAKLRYWSEQASRILEAGLPKPPNKGRTLFAEKIEQSFLAELEAQLRFLAASLAASSDAAVEILWACMRILNLSAATLEKVTLRDASRALAARLRLLLNPHPAEIPVGSFVEIAPDILVSDYIRAAGFTMNRIKDTVDTRFRRQNGGAQIR